jgi:hypothetical protein
MDFFLFVITDKIINPSQILQEKIIIIQQIIFYTSLLYINTSILVLFNFSISPHPHPYNTPKSLRKAILYY